MVYNIFCSQFDNNLDLIAWTSNLYACLILQIQLWATKINVFFYQMWPAEKVDNFQKFCSRHNKIFSDILIFLVFSKSGIQYLWQGEISACKVLVPIKVVPVKNNHYIHAYISHELLVRLIPTWIWYDLLTVSQIWSSNHQLSCFF